MNHDDIQAALHHQQQLEQQEQELAPWDQPNIRPAYCDKIAASIKDALNATDPDGIIMGCGKVRFDLHPEDGYLISTKKRLTAVDKNGKLYQITVEEM
jgi:hypothetical protein